MWGEGRGDDRKGGLELGGEGEKESLGQFWGDGIYIVSQPKPAKARIRSDGAYLVRSLWRTVHPRSHYQTWADQSVLVGIGVFLGIYHYLTLACRSGQSGLVRRGR